MKRVIVIGGAWEAEESRHAPFEAYMKRIIVIGGAWEAEESRHAPF
ncbi:MAG: hypothetical protein ACI4D4_03690 [Lachnospira sp.]